MIILVQATPVDMEDVAIRLTGRSGPKAEGWLAEVPTVAARLASGWDSWPVSCSRAGLIYRHALSMAVRTSCHAADRVSDGVRLALLPRGGC